MSISGDLLTSPTPARLLCRRGTWVLELVRLVAVDRNVFQPRVQRLEGSEAVLQYLKRSSDPALASAANQLMRGLRSEDERAFDAVDGDWVPGALGPRRDSTRPSAPPPGGGNMAEVAELRAELLVLRAAHERLRERVQRVESQIQSGGRARDVLSIPPTPSFVMPKASEASEPAATIASGGASEPAGAQGTSSGPAIGGSSMPAQAATRVSGASSVAASGLGLPSIAAVNESLRGLIGDVATAQEKRPSAFNVSTLGPCWVSRLIDDEGHDVGAIIADRAAAFTLGGALMSLPELELTAQRTLGTPSEDVLGAMSEVANNLCETINQSSRLKVRVKPIEPLAMGSLEWADKPGASLELELSGGLGRLFLFAH
jgi:hypothetical protein